MRGRKFLLQDLNKQLYNLDSKAKSTIGNAVIETNFAKVSTCKIEKVIGDILCTQYEGVTIVKAQKRKNLIRNYENFFA